MGDTGPLYENWFLQQAVEAKDWELVRQLTQEMSSIHPRWGWKLPAMANHLGMVSSLFPAARFVFVMRNPVSTASTKKRLLNPDDIGAEIQKVAASYVSIAKFARSCSMPMLFVPFEEALIQQPTAIRTLARFCRLKVSNVTQVAIRVSADRRIYQGSPFPEPPLASDINDRLQATCEKRGKRFPGYPRESDGIAHSDSLVPTE